MSGTGGSLVEDKVPGASSVGAGCFTFRCSRLWADLRWGHLDEDVGLSWFLFSTWSTAVCSESWTLGCYSCLAG